MNEEAIFAAALDKKTARERQEYLDQACAGNAELRAQIEELLRADSDAGSFLQNPPLPLDATVASGETARSSADSGAWISRLSFLQPCNTPGRLGKLTGKVGEYEIIEIVGHGGMGAVLRAFDTKLSRVVAVKVMAPELAANPVAVKRFLREATTAAAVHHDHVVTIHAVDDSHQPPYLVMQFVEGQTLQEKIDREGALQLKHILRIGSQAAVGLAAAHKTGLIHRDVKPSNILLENGVERVKISDFGLARAADDVQVTQTGIIAGTPQYMSPEQAKGEPIDARGDLFSLGSVLYTMCTGRPAFRADNPVAVLRRVCDDTPRPIHEINPEIPQWLCEIVDKLLEKKPDDRFQSAQEVGELLAQHLAHLQQPASCPMPPRIAVGPTAEAAATKNMLASEIRLYRATSILSLVAFMLAVIGATFMGRSWNSPLAVWLFAGGILSLPLAMAILFATQQAEARQSYDWAIAAACLSLLPINPFLIFCIPVTIWSLTTVLRAGGQSRLALERELKKPIAAASSGGLSRPAAPLWITCGGLVFALVGIFGFILKEFSLIGGRALGLTLIILVFAWLVAFTVWLLMNHRKLTHVSRVYDFSAKPPKLTARGVFIEHPVLGVLAVVMLIVSASIATYMLTAAAGRRTQVGATAGLSGFAPVSEWIQLFNGKDLTGWKAPSNQLAFWKVEGGELVGTGAPSHLFSERGDYQDFHLRVEAQVNDGGSSGVYFRVPDFAATRYGQFPDGYEANINSTCATDTDKTGSLTGSLRGVAPFKDALHKPDEWFTLEVRVQGQRIVIQVNGQTTVDFVDSNNSFRRGHLALQVWPAETVVRFRKIEIKEVRTGAAAGLPSSAPATPPLATAPFDAEQAKAHQDAWAKHLGMPVEITNSIGMKLRLIPPGKGTAKPSGIAESAFPFFLGATEVTVGQFRRFVGETGYQTRIEKNQLGGAKVQGAKESQRRREYVWNNPEFAPSDDYPVALTTWHDATAFCDWLSKKEGRTYRLPTSDEWNWAARAGSAARFYFGDELSDLDAHAWLLGNSGHHTHPTGNKLPNSWGLFDMYGNVWELSYTFERGGEPFSPGQARGGPQSAERIYYWGGSFHNPPEYMNFGNGPSTVGFSHLGFRVVIVGDLKAAAKTEIEPKTN